MTLKTYYHYLVSITYTLRGISNFEVKNEQKPPVQTPKSFHRGGYKLARDQIGTPLFIQSVVINGYSMRWLSIISFAACFYFLKVIIVTPPPPFYLCECEYCIPPGRDPLQTHKNVVYDFQI